MLKITIDTIGGGTTLKLEGRLAGPWVRELEQIWQVALTDPTCKSIIVDLCGVTFIDAKARELLTRVYCRGARFKMAGFLVKSIMEEIKEECERAHHELLHPEGTAQRGLTTATKPDDRSPLAPLGERGRG
jgi:hypothetical protein